MNASREQGFSLVEQLVVVLIIGILAAIPSLGAIRTLRDQRLKAAAEGLATTIDELRRRAIQESRSCTAEVVAASGELRPAATNACSAFPTFSVAEAAGGPVLLCADALGPTAAAPACTANSGSVTLVLTPRGTSTSDALLQLAIAGHSPNRCVQLIAPLGLLRLGRIANNRCDWSSAF
jgi:prepilin-type N-terminal cleavage/methylation domain-containing protein